VGSVSMLIGSVMATMTAIQMERMNMHVMDLLRRAASAVMMAGVSQMTGTVMPSKTATHNLRMRLTAMAL